LNSDSYRTETDPDFDRARKVLSRISVRQFVFVGFFLLIIATMVAVIIAGEEMDNFEQVLIIASLGAIAPLLVWLWLKFHRLQVPMTSLFNRNRFSANELLLVIPLILFTLGLFSSLLTLAAFLDPNLFEMIQGFLDNDFMLITEDTGLLMILGIILLVGIIGPLFEEVVFRGLMVERLGAKYGYSGAVIFSSVLFGFLHIDVIGAALFGFAMCLLYLKTGSLLAPVLIHMINNLLAILMVYSSWQLNWDAFESAEFYMQYWWFWVLLLAVSTVWLMRYITSHWKLIYEKEPVSLTRGPEQPEAEIE
jgi:uncharacterized protein